MDRHCPVGQILTLAFFAFVPQSSKNNCQSFAYPLSYPQPALAFFRLGEWTLIVFALVGNEKLIARKVPTLLHCCKPDGLHKSQIQCVAGIQAAVLWQPQLCRALSLCLAMHLEKLSLGCEKINAISG